MLFFMQFCATKYWDKLSVNIDHVYCILCTFTKHMHYLPTVNENIIGTPKMRNNLDAIKMLAIDLCKIIFLQLFCSIFGISSLFHLWYQFFASFLVSVLCFICGISPLLHFWYQFFAAFLVIVLCFIFVIIALLLFPYRSSKVVALN